MPSNLSQLGQREGENRFGVSKFNEEQTRERLKQHALAILHGNRPTISQIVDIWKEKFGICITVQSEAEWRRTNLATIEQYLHGLVSSGEIEVDLPSTDLMLKQRLVKTIHSGHILGRSKTALTSMMKKARKWVEEEPLEMLGLTINDIAGADVDEVVLDKNNARLKRLMVYRDAQLNALKTVNEIFISQSSNASNDLKELAKESGGADLAKLKYRNKIGNALEAGGRFERDTDGEHEVPLLEEVTDEDRQQLGV